MGTSVGVPGTHSGLKICQEDSRDLVVSATHAKIYYSKKDSKQNQSREKAHGVKCRGNQAELPESLPADWCLIPPPCHNELQ